MGEIGVAIIIALVVLVGIVFFIAVEQGKELAKYERESHEHNSAKKQVKVGKAK